MFQNLPATQHITQSKTFTDVNKEVSDKWPLPRGSSNTPSLPAAFIVHHSNYDNYTQGMKCKFPVCSTTRHMNFTNELFVCEK
jgi:hypothetical protein